MRSHRSFWEDGLGPPTRQCYERKSPLWSALLCSCSPERHVIYWSVLPVIVTDLSATSMGTRESHFVVDRAATMTAGSFPDGNRVVRIVELPQ